MEEHIIVGLLLVISGLFILASSGNFEAGGVIFLGPLPLPFGSRRIWLPLTVIGAAIILAYHLIGPGLT